MLTLARQHPQLRKQSHLDRIYDGLRTEYRHYARRHDFVSLDELISLTDDFEALKREERPQASHMMTPFEYSRNTRCWRCKRTGHKRTTCTRPYRLFCSYCGLDGVYSRTCLCRSHLPTTNEEGTPKDDDRYYIGVNVCGQRIVALIDTGASRTYIGDTIRQHLLGQKISPICTEEMVQMADQSLATSVEMFPISIEYQGRRVNLRASAITSLAEPIILGMDYLSTLNLELRLNGKVLERSENTPEGAPKPSVFIPPPETRPKILPNVVIQSPRSELASTSPPLAYISNRRVGIAHVPDISATATMTTAHTSSATPTNIPTTHERPSLQTTILTKQPLAGTTSTSTARPMKRAATARKPAPPRTPHYASDELFAGIKVSAPKKYRKHKQYVIRRGALPDVKVTILSQSVARLLCQGREKIVALNKWKRTRKRKRKVSGPSLPFGRLILPLR